LTAGQDTDDFAENHHYDDKAKATAEDDDEDEPLG
jgi:hypothetical protein